jgi:uncharacterized protein YegP (UPF0339 family)
MATTPYFTIRHDADGYRARFYGSNGELVWWTEGYSRKEGAQHAIALLKVYAPDATVYDRTT